MTALVRERHQLMVAVGRDLATVRVHGWRYGIGIGGDAFPRPGLGEGRIRVRSSAAGRRLIEVSTDAPRRWPPMGLDMTPHTRTLSQNAAGMSYL